MFRDKIFNEIDAERTYQDAQWGGESHDATHSIRDWASYIIVYLGKMLGRESDWGYDIPFARKMLIKVAALSVAAVESIDRKN